MMDEDRPLLSEVAGAFTTLPLPKADTMNFAELHDDILHSRNKGEMIKAFWKFASFHGAFNGASPEVYEKLKSATEPKSNSEKK